MAYKTMAAWLATAIPVIAGAAEPAYHVAITPFAGYRMGGSVDDGDEPDINLDDAGAFGLIINLPADTIGTEAYTEWEIYYSHQSAGIDSAPAAVDPNLDLDISYLLAGGTYVFEGESFQPFIAAGIGAAHLAPDESGYDSDTVFAFGLGGGAKLFPASRVGLRLEARVLGAVIDSDSSIFCASGSGGAGCAVRTSGNVMWQWEVLSGLTVRF